MAISTGPKPRPRIGLALGSGMARGWAHIGVVRALERHGIQPDIIAGTSIGALVGGIYLAGRIQPLEDWARALTRLRLVSYMDFGMRTGGFLGGHRLFDLIRSHLGAMLISDLPRPFVAVATDLVTGHEVWLRHEPLVDAMRASISLPGIFEPCRLDGRWLVDGALVNPVPVSVCQALGAQMTIAVNLNGDLIGKSRRSSLLQALGQLETHGTASPVEPPPSPLRMALGRRRRRPERNRPNLFNVMVSTVNIVQDRITRSRLAGDPPDVHIMPRLGHIGLVEFDRTDEIIAEGDAAVERIMPEIKEALSVLGAYGQGNGGRVPA
jgi:NTE family protein